MKYIYGLSCQMQIRRLPFVVLNYVTNQRKISKFIAIFQKFMYRVLFMDFLA